MISNLKRVSISIAKITQSGIYDDKTTIGKLITNGKELLIFFTIGKIACTLREQLQSRLEIEFWGAIGKESHFKIGFLECPGPL